MEKHFGLQEGQQIVSFNSILELIKKLKYYLENTTERETIADCGYNWVMSNRTWDHTVNDFMQIITKDKSLKITL
jgi:spore maturation protein CgeB